MRSTPGACLPGASASIRSCSMQGSQCGTRAMAKGLEFALRRHRGWLPACRPPAAPTCSVWVEATRLQLRSSTSKGALPLLLLPASCPELPPSGWREGRPMAGTGACCRGRAAGSQENDAVCAIRCRGRHGSRHKSGKLARKRPKKTRLFALPRALVASNFRSIESSHPVGQPKGGPRRSKRANNPSHKSQRTQAH